ncbi:hypothetical protein [Spongiactinospora sp. TRM90649]|uniref:hypothetical protein n=1 Tax=Spongiactinospora sp. TRM90649 TaxID=3031114 RepID=UPI0023F86EDA|nr:hypothetical protein [Spongiactinospora sp. TRM90649]MDF5754215.1 hypothetical protein [Spongiactinospora sp. TRM90649]
MRRSRRFTLAVSAALLAVPLLHAPAAHGAADVQICFSGDRTPAEGGYRVTARGCYGGGLYMLELTVRFGPGAGVYFCRDAFSWNGDLVANRCVLKS